MWLMWCDKADGDNHGILVNQNKIKNMKQHF
jgi:hypothetical protein